MFTKFTSGLTLTGALALLLSLALVELAGSQAQAQIIGPRDTAQPQTDIWVFNTSYLNGRFYRTAGTRQWTEENDRARCQFVEAARTRDSYTQEPYIELHDASRNITVRLYAGYSTIRHRGTKGKFDVLYKGYWKQ